MNKQKKRLLALAAAMSLVTGCSKGAKEDKKLPDEEKTEQKEEVKTSKEVEPEEPEKEKAPEKDVIEKEPEKKEAPAPEEAEGGIRPEFKAAIDELVSFYEEYAGFMERVQENPDDIGLLMEMTDWIDRLDTMDEKLDALDQTQGDMSNEELKYYLEATAKIYQLLAGAALS